MTNSIFAACGMTVFDVMSRLAQSCGAINLGQGFPEGLEPAEVIEAAARALRDGPHQYPPMMGLPVLRQAIAANAARWHGLTFDWETEVMITSGATEALADCFLGLLNPGDEVLVFEPAYDSYRPILRRGGAVPVAVRLTPPDWALPLAELEAAITPRTRALVLNTPMNPCGKVFTQAELEALADLMLRHNLIAICDEVYEHLTYDGLAHRSLMHLPAVRDRCLRISSAGKTFSVTGWKIGAITGPAALLTPVARAHQFVTFTTPPALQSAVAFGLGLPDSYFTGLRADLQARRDLLRGGLERLGFTVLPCQGSYFLSASAPPGSPLADRLARQPATAEEEEPGLSVDTALCRRLTRSAGVAAIPLSAFYEANPVTSQIRFCFAKTTPTLTAALERLERWLTAL